MLLTRSDCIKAQFITSVIDARDHEYILGATKLVEPFADCQRRDIASGQDNTTSTRNSWSAMAGLMTFDEAVKAQCSSDEKYTTYLANIPTGSSLTQRRAAALEVLQKEVFFDWELPRSVQGQYMYQWCAKAVIERQLAAASLGDVSWPRMDYPDEALIAEIHAGVTERYPGRMFCYGYTGSFDWKANGFSYEDVKAFPGKMAKYGAVFQIQPVWVSQGVGLYTLQSCKILKEEGIAGYVERIQNPALAGAGNGLSANGSFLADAFFETILARDA